MTSKKTTVPDGNPVTLSHCRKLMCLEAAYELDALARLLPGLVPNDADAEGAHHAVRGIAGRFLRLSSVLMSLFDDDPTDAYLQGVIYVNDGQG